LSSRVFCKALGHYWVWVAQTECGDALRKAAELLTVRTDPGSLPWEISGRTTGSTEQSQRLSSP